MNPSSVPLPDGHPAYLRMVWARAGTTVRAYSFSSRIVGRYMHWIDGRTQLCLQPDAHCAWCHAGIGHRWYGFLFGHSIDKHCPCLVQLTAECVRACLILRDQGIDLRGAEIQLSRAATPRNAPVLAKIRLDARTRDLPPDEPDVLDHLRRFYGVEAYPEGRHCLDRREEE